MAEIRVNSPAGQYPILIEPGALKRLPDLLKVNGGRTVIVTNATLVPLYGEALAELLPDSVVTTMPDGEQFKTLDTVRQLYDDFVAAGLDRSGTVIALGGGVVGDTAGFAAASYMRGVRLVQIPTSLLSMVDSSVGGKVGVDLPQGKNLVGAFKQPDQVIIDTDTLDTLPDVEWRNGLAEVIKHGLLADSVLLEPDTLKRDRAPELVRRAVQVKVDVVEQDPYEKGIRAHLNLGHTFAHAIEQVSGYAWAHGAAVAVGLLAAARLSSKLGLCAPTLVDQVERLLVQQALPTRLADMEPAAIYAAMGTDKKWRNGRSRFILLRDIGDVLVVEDVARDAVIAVLEELKT